jgi:hypothetical protein
VKGTRPGRESVGADWYRRGVLDGFTLTDQSGEPLTLSDQLDAAALLVFLRGDW